ncbi:MAG: cellulase family glycosylhydrolase [Actinobacteria bacterium]|nr:cellulase family glycosylhydrolase [Actinomycetota bacterium]
MRRLVMLALTCALMGLFAPIGSAGSGVRFGIQDDAWLAHGPGTIETRLDRLERLGVDLVRFNLHWNEIEPARGAPNWDSSDTVLQGLRQRKIGAVVGLVGAPRWANGGRAPNDVPTAASFAAFARAAASRYSWVREWLVWNEPNQARWLKPTTPAVYVRSLLNPAYTAIHAVNPRAMVAGGVTAPRAGSSGVSPVQWIRGMRAAGARLDAYAHHPYPGRPSDSPSAGGCQVAGCETITMATLERLLAEVTRAFGPKRIWLTEYGYQTGPGGVTQQRQADLLGQAALRVYKAARVDLLIHYLVVDEPTSERFQSGLFTTAGKPKLAALAFPLPLVQTGRSAGKVVLWGQVRAGLGAQSYRVQASSGTGWRFLGGTRRTSSRGYLSAVVSVPTRSLIRIFSVRDGVFGAPLLVR